MNGSSTSIWVASLALACSSTVAQTRTIDVANDASLQAALATVTPGTRIRIAPGSYQPGVFVRSVKGTQRQPIEIGGLDPQNPPLFVGGTVAWQLVDCEYLRLHDMIVRKQTDNGINVDDGGSYETPSHHMVLEGIQVEEIGPRGNRDGIKLSGVDDFPVRSPIHSPSRTISGTAKIGRNRVGPICQPRRRAASTVSRTSATARVLPF